MEWGKGDEQNDPRHIKKSFKQLRSSIQSYASSSLQRVAELQLSNHIPVSRPSDSASKSKVQNIKRKRLNYKGEQAGSNQADRKNFTSPTTVLMLPLESPANSVKYIQMRRSENDRILSHVRNTSLTDKNTNTGKGSSTNAVKNGQFTKTKAVSGTSCHHGYKSREPTAKTSLRETDVASSKVSSNKMLNQILSLYDKKSSKKPLESAATAKVLVPRFNLNGNETAGEKRSESLMRKQMSVVTPPFTNNYLNKVKEILSARKPSYRQSQAEPKRSPNSHKSRWTFFSSLKEGDLLKIYDMSSTENLTKQFQEKDGLLSRGSLAKPDSQMPYSPHNNTNVSMLERDAGSEEHCFEDTVPRDSVGMRQSIISEATTTNLGQGHYHDPRLGDVMNKLLQLVSSRDELIISLRSENRSLKATVSSLTKQLESAKKKLTLYTKL